jgi:hypothetical protein
MICDIRALAVAMQGTAKSSEKYISQLIHVHYLERKKEQHCFVSAMLQNMQPVHWCCNLSSRLKETKGQFQSQGWVTSWNTA